MVNDRKLFEGYAKFQKDDKEYVDEVFDHKYHMRVVFVDDDGNISDPVELHEMTSLELSELEIVAAAVRKAKW